MRVFVSMIVAVGAALAGSCASITANGAASEPSWRLAYAHDADGVALDGAKEDLLMAIRDGKPVRLYFRGRRVEHVVDGGFLTILAGEAFAQIAPIETQTPSVDPAAIDFRQPGQHWRAIIGSDGSFKAFADGNAPNSRTQAVRWYVQD